MDQQVQKGIDEGLTNFTAKYDLDTTVVDDLRQMLVAAMRTHVKPRAAGTGGAKSEGKRPRLKTGYNLYIRAKFEEAKASGADEGSKTNSQELMASFSKEWKDLSADERAPYIEQADAINAENGAEASGAKKKSGKKSLSGYNLFYSENKDEIRESKDKDLSLMKAVGAAWKALSKEEQDKFKERAAEMSAERD